MIVIAKGYVFVDYRGLGGTLGIHREVRHVSGVVALRIVQAMLLALRIEMRTGRLEIRRIALGVLMNMDCVFPGRKILQVEANFHPLFLRLDLGRTDTFPLGILQFDSFWLFFGGCADHKQTCQAGNSECVQKRFRHGDALYPEEPPFPWRNTVVYSALFPVRRSFPYDTPTPTPSAYIRACAPTSHSQFRDPRPGEASVILPVSRKGPSLKLTRPFSYMFLSISQFA